MMAFDVVIQGSAGVVVRALIEDLVGERPIREEGGCTIVGAADQAELIGLLTHLHDLGLGVDEVRAVSSAPSTAVDG